MAPSPLSTLLPFLLPFLLALLPAPSASLPMPTDFQPKTKYKEWELPEEVWQKEWSLIPGYDECWDGEAYGECDPAKFPVCGRDEYRCFNRSNRRDKFEPDGNPSFYIDYERVFCYKWDWDCSSCTPGRMCQQERRCILDEFHF
eukprot:CAMPEP_0194295402 /NCGR_PEP_ID=MMETSP0169-20130528/53367_1 /TAXON_ID=218684 /ORGANISM="Corethron pennatum, Strain L29A3" /LENGTH=143 /DNA_ID=CAMNT_0039044551 /DNA_START=72 /DNA_END=500 /DNA_ORIENTATION=+